MEHHRPNLRKFNISYSTNRQTFLKYLPGYLFNHLPNHQCQQVAQQHLDIVDTYQTPPIPSFFS